MKMLKNLNYLLRVTDTKMGAAALGEMIHGLFLAAPTGMLLLIIWELFEEQPDQWSIWMKVIILAVMFVLQMWVAAKVTLKTNFNIISMTTKLRLMLGDRLHRP